jgi:hypothetical protein
MCVVAFSVALPLVSAALPLTRPSVDGERLGATFATVTATDGWDVNVIDSSLGIPTLTAGDVKVSVSAALWYGESEDLLARVVEWMVDDGFEASVPHVDDATVEGDRETHLITLTSAETEGEIYVVRDALAVGVVTVRGSDGATPAQREAIDHIVSTLELEDIDLTLEEPDL